MGRLAGAAAFRKSRAGVWSVTGILRRGSDDPSSDALCHCFVPFAFASGDTLRVCKCSLSCCRAERNMVCAICVGEWRPSQGLRGVVVPSAVCFGPFAFKSGDLLGPSAFPSGDPVALSVLEILLGGRGANHNILRAICIYKWRPCRVEGPRNTERK